MTNEAVVLRITACLRGQFTRTIPAAQCTTTAAVSQFCSLFLRQFRCSTPAIIKYFLEDAAVAGPNNNIVLADLLLFLFHFLATIRYVVVIPPVHHYIFHEPRASNTRIGTE